MRYQSAYLDEKMQPTLATLVERYEICRGLECPTEWQLKAGLLSDSADPSSSRTYLVLGCSSCVWIGDSKKIAFRCITSVSSQVLEASLHPYWRKFE